MLTRDCITLVKGVHHRPVGNEESRRHGDPNYGDEPAHPG